MNRNFKKIFFSYLALAINVQLAFSPLAIAQKSKKSTKWDNFSDVAAKITEVGYQAAQAYAQGMQQSNNAQQGNMVEQYKRTLEPMIKIQPIDQRQVPKVFQGCFVLPASGNKLTGGMSCEGANDQQIISGYADAITDIADFNITQLQNFQTVGHERYTAQGVGCYDKKIERLNAMLKAREEQLNLFKNYLKHQMKELKKNLDPTLKLIKQDNALLTGKPAGLLKDIKFDDALFDAQDKQNNNKDNICKTIISPEAVIKAGKSGGLRKIEEDLNAKLSQKENGGLSALQLTNDRTYNDIRDEIKTITNRLADKMQSSQSITADSNSVSYRPKFIDKNGGAFSAVLKNFNANMNSELSALKKESSVKQLIQGNKQAASIVNQIENDGNSNIDKRIKDFERTTKNACLNNTIKQNFGSVSAFARKFRNPNISKQLSDEADNAFATIIESSITNDQSDFDAIKSRINTAEGKGLNSAKVLITGKSFSFQGKTINASTPLRASDFLDILTKNCESQFDHTENADGFSNAKIRDNLRAYSNKIKGLRRTAATKFKTNITNELIKCTEDTSTGSSALSCSTETMNTKASSFCLRTARTCAENFKGCHKKADNLVKSVRKRQIRHAEVYNTAVKATKEGIEKQFFALNKRLVTAAREIDGMLDLGTVFSSPDLKLDMKKLFPLGDKDLANSKELELESPEKILENALAQVEEMDKKLKKQRAPKGENSVIAKLNDVKKTYIDNYRNQEQYWNEVKRSCGQRIGAVQKMLNDQEKKIAEDNEKIRNACDQLLAFNGDNCGSDISDLVKAVSDASAIASSQQQGVPTNGLDGKNATIRKLTQAKKMCDLDDNTYIPASVDLPDDAVEKYCKRRRSKECDQYAIMLKDHPVVCKDISELASKINVCQKDTTVKITAADCSSLGAGYEKISDNDVIEETLRDKLDKNKKSVYTKAKCYLDEDGQRPEALENIRKEALVAYQKQESSSHGEQKVTMAMCNGGYDGQFDSDDPWASAASTIGSALGELHSIERE